MLAARYSTIGIPLIPGAAGPATETTTTCATVLCADLHGYDAIVAQLPAFQVVSLLQEFFAILTGAVLECGGQIFHLAGADMMAGFGVGDSRHTQIHEALTALTLVGDTTHIAAQLCRRARAGEVLLSAAVHLPHICDTAAVGTTESMPLLHLPQLQLRGRAAPLDVWCAPAVRRLKMRHSAESGHSRH
jgi:class 3 adenylate cyclase